MKVETHPVARLQHVVLVDDDDMDNRFHSIVLRKAGFAGRLSVFETGEAALERLLVDAPEPVDLLLLDINLPGKDGFEVATALTGASRLPDLIVVMLTSSPDPAETRRARSIPVIRDYVTKPLTAEALARILAEHAPRP